MRDPRLERLADVLVSYSINAKPDQLVRIKSSPTAIPLVTALYQRVLEAGAHPMIHLTPEDAQELLLKHGNDKQLAYVNPVAKYEVERIDCSISVWAEGNPRALSNVDPERMRRNDAARRPLLDTFLKRAATKELKWVGTQYPTQGCAQDAEMSLAEFEEFVFRAGLLDHADPIAAWKKVSERQQRLVDYLNGKRDYRVVAANGTDVRMSVAGRTWINCDGHENFPDGEVFTGPVLDSVNGQINFSFPAVYGGREVLGVKLTFRNGKVVDASAEKGQDYLYKMLDMDAGSRFLGECAIGTNYSIRQFTRTLLFDEKIGGTVHFALGAGYPESGNTNESGLHWDMVVDLRGGGYVEIDGVKVNENGKFTRAEFPSA